MASDNNNQTTLVLGDEYDDALRTKLFRVLKEFGATSSESADLFVAGSQEIEAINVIVDGHELHIEAETFIGLSISGPSDLVNQISRLMTLQS